MKFAPNDGKMQITQFEDKNLAHYSYAIMSDCGKKIMLIDPARNPQPYIDFAYENKADITGVIETHPHADFVSSHLELYQSAGATIYASRIADATYPYQAFDEGQSLQLGKIKLSAINTPGHSPDSICILLEHDDKQKAVFTGDTLFIGDCGRPDLRAGDGDAKEEAVKLAKQLYHSLRDKLMSLNDDVTVYPAHGAGTLCGKAVSKAGSSTIGREKKTNWSLKQQTEDEFVTELLSDQPFIPAYFPFDVALNKKGVAGFRDSINSVVMGEPVTNETTARRLHEDLWIIDVRNEKEYKEGHLPHSINLMKETKFETWLGTIIKPGEKFYLTANDDKTLREAIERAASIGYEMQIKEAFIVTYNKVVQEEIDADKFKAHISDYTIIDVRNTSEAVEKKIFENSIPVPLSELLESISAIPLDKPIVVHCASGFRSAAGSSILQSKLKGAVKIFDLGEAVKKFM